MATPFAGVQASSVYRQKVGAFEITVLSDGNLALEATLFSGDQARAEKLLEAAFLPKVGIPTSVNEWLINPGEKLILVDTGASNGFVPTLGCLPQNLAAAGVDPSAVDTVVITHMHSDHGMCANDQKWPRRQAALKRFRRRIVSPRLRSTASRTPPTNVRFGS